MCGRFTQTKTAEVVAEAFQVVAISTIQPSYNIAPSQAVVAVLKTSLQSQRQIQLLQWGLVPAWAKNTKLGARLINARAETVAQKPSFRVAFRQRRCLIVGDGFYEWQTTAVGKQPFYFHLQDQGLFAFAGLWEEWHPPGGDLLSTCTILTTTANALLRPIHQRMPVILQPGDYDLWLDPQVQTPNALEALLRPYPAEQMQAYPVNLAVNRASFNHPCCLDPAPSL